MIIFGTRGVTYKHQAGGFFCPLCRGDADYKAKRVRRFFTLYFIPVIPLDLLGEYVECQGCQGTFDNAVLEYDPRAESAAFEAEFHKAIRQTMVQMVIADGVVEDEELVTLREIYQGLTGIDLETEALRQECESTQATDIAAVVGGFAGRLNENGKEMVLSAAVQVATSDDDFADEERDLVLAIGKSLEMSSAHVKGVLAEALEG